MKLGIAQINPTVGDLDGNSKCILNAYAEQVEKGAQIVLFPELAVCGYPPRDLLFNGSFVADNKAALVRIARQIGNVPAVIGFVEECSHGTAHRLLHNAVAWCENGKIKATGHKMLLPSYDVFDEGRYFTPGVAPLIHEWQGQRIGITICEDIWNDKEMQGHRTYAEDPVRILSKQGIDLLLNLSASPWHSRKKEERKSIVLTAARRCRCPVAYCNAVGGNDELIFDGTSIVACPRRGIIAGLAAFRSDSMVIDLQGIDRPFISRFHNPSGNAATHEALVLGLSDYARKSGFKKALIGLSGGIDSAVACALAVKAFGSENVIGIALPSSISSQHSREDAATLATNLGIEYHEIAITGMVDASEKALAPIFQNLKKDATEENIQARSRGLLLMGISNKFNALLLTTGNKSEIAVGYCTLYGDMCGGLAVISDLLKTEVYALARYINTEREIIPFNTIEKPPSAELRPDQKDEDSLPPYPVLDGILQLYVEERFSIDEIVARGYDRNITSDIIRKVDLNEYKRQQAAPGLKITPLAFGSGRRIPIVQKYFH